MRVRFVAIGAVALLGLSACQGSPARRVDIVHDEFADAQAAIRAEILALNEIIANQDVEALRAAHLDSPKFSDIGEGFERQDFDQMLAAETAAMQSLEGIQVDFQDLEINVFGEVAVATCFPSFSWIASNGERTGMQRRATIVYVNTPDGWKIAHEHLSAPAEPTSSD